MTSLNNEQVSRRDRGPCTNGRKERKRRDFLYKRGPRPLPPSKVSEFLVGQSAWQESLFGIRAEKSIDSLMYFVFPTTIMKEAPCSGSPASPDLNSARQTIPRSFFAPRYILQDHSTVVAEVSNRLLPRTGELAPRRGRDWHNIICKQDRIKNEHGI